MLSPFPVMNPYLERDVVRHDFHERFLILGAGVIGAQIRPDFIVRVDDHLGRADLSIVKTPHRERVPPEGVALLDAPARVRLCQVEPTREAYLQILDRGSREVVTVVELLSPSNERRSGPDRSQYLAKRMGVFASRTNLVEIDLLRDGSPMPDEARPDCVDSVLASRPDERHDAGFWPIKLADRPPIIPIPLRAPWPDASLDMQALLDRVYDEAGYEYDVNDRPPQPPLSPGEAEWAAEFLPDIR